MKNSFFQSISIFRITIRSWYEEWKRQQRQGIIIFFSSTTFIIIIVLLILIIWYWNKLPPQIPLFYSRPWGKEQLVSPVLLFIYPVFSAVCYILNAILSVTLTKSHQFFSQLLYGTSLLVTIFSIIGCFAILIVIL